MARRSVTMAHFVTRVTKRVKSNIYIYKIKAAAFVYYSRDSSGFQKNLAFCGDFFFYKFSFFSLLLKKISIHSHNYIIYFNHKSGG